jgi:hypothetical protein
MLLYEFGAIIMLPCVTQFGIKFPLAVFGYEGETDELGT